MFGYAVHESSWPASEVREVGRWSERWRFALGAGDDPRARALQASAPPLARRAGGCGTPAAQAPPLALAGSPPLPSDSSTAAGQVCASRGLAEALARPGPTLLSELGPRAVEPEWHRVHPDSDLWIDPEFPELYQSKIDAHPWRLIQARPYHHREPIHLKEGRAVLFGLKRKARQIRNHHQRHLALTDNLGLALALEKGRATDFRMLRLCRLA